MVEKFKINPHNDNLCKKLSSSEYAGFHCFYRKMEIKDENHNNVVTKVQGTLFDSLEIEQVTGGVSTQKINKHYFQPNFQPKNLKRNYFELQNRRYLGNKYKLLGFMGDIILDKCGAMNSFCDIFAGTGVVGKNSIVLKLR